MKLSQTHTRLFLAIAAMLPCAGTFAQTTPVDTTPAASTPDEATQLDAVEVRGEYIPEPMQQTSEVASFVTREDLERTGDSDAAASLTRVTGLSLVNDKFVYVRGLGERYSSALLNGSPLPSPEPLQRVVPLDLFPSEVLQGITVQKSYSVKYPGEFGGGVIDLQSLTVPDEPFFKLTIGGGANSVTTFEKGLTHYGSDTDFWGYDDGTRKLPSDLGDAIATGQRIDLGNFSREDIRRIGRSFQNANLNLLQEKDSINPDVNFGASGGWSIDLDEDSKLGFVAVAGFENEWRTRFGKEQQGFFVGDVVEFDSDYDFLRTQNNAKVNVLLGTGYENGNHSVNLTTLYVHDTIKETGSRSGLDDLAGFVARDDQTEWFERELMNHQVSGTHVFGEYDDVKVEWRGAVARATRDVPYEKSIRYELIDGFWAHDGSRVQNSTSFSDVEDNLTSGGIDLSWRLPTERELVLSGGVAYSDNDRNSESRQFRFLALDGSLPFFNRYQRPDFLFSDFNLSQDLLRIRETTGNFGAAAYDAALEVKAAYLQVEGEIVPLVRASVGVRYEDATQAVYPYNIFTGVREPGGPDPLVNDYLLPAATVTWNFADNMQLRLGASRTIARPQFRELAPQQYQDPDIDRLFRGNAFLIDSELTNLDARFEWFFAQGEYLTLGVFHKLIDNPIESNVNFAGGTTFQSFLNAPEATVYGAEVEFKKYFDLPIQANWWGNNRLYLATNYTWSNSEVSVDDGDTLIPAGFVAPVEASLFVTDGSALQGQSDHIANLQIGIEDDTTRTQATLIANYVSERVSARGRPGQPDYIQKPGTSLDLVLRKGFMLGDKEMTLGFSARNLLETEYQEFQERGGNRVDVLRYDPGVSYSLSLSASF